MTETDRLKKVLDFVKSTFVGKNDVVDLLGICLVARENAFLYGPPGTAKSAIIRTLSNCVTDGKNFEYLFTRFTEPIEIFGPFDIRKLKEGDLITNTSGMMPEASMVFLDEIFNANSAILNSLLTALNEKIFRRGKEIKKLPALMFVGASNVLPEDDALNALFDRFLVRVLVDNVNPDLLSQVLISGRKLERGESLDAPEITSSEIKIIQNECKNVDLKPIYESYINCIFNLRNTGISISDRRAVKLQNLISASAILCGRNYAILSDLWVLKHIWDNEEQIEILEGIINHIIEKDEEPNAHPQASFNKTPNPEELMKDVENLKEKWQNQSLNFEEQNVVKDKLRYLQTRSEWLKDAAQKQYIQAEIDSLWQKILKTL
ncbi:AAA family ATPase [Frigoriflavimonas asaccharolytica]|uniref:MoxR-like ATPase n=1 Tax=Frigoriflavimonas asaccharolytica TaxID=2735899 RepID=A0A8J8GAH3_9FLAO|nr:AAA family ATPase [Frigoriflavimonas asaccharolytica]NRS93650.1 MoxR-like ATPase [Frigoriflavimonas asaccharolytica]